MTAHIAPGFEIKQGEKIFVQLKLPASVITMISYAAMRGRDEEPGAVQRVLNTRRISSIKEFCLAGGDFPSNIILNWVTETDRVLLTGESYRIPILDRAAQIIDGQHRVSGLRAAIEERPEIGNLEIPVALYSHLSTQECANIFLAINTEQKPVPRSLVFDLYEIASSTLVDDAAVRARDIVTALNTDEQSPYREQFKYPGDPRRKGGIALSTAVTEIKPLVEAKGDFEQVGINSLEMQKQILVNYWSALAVKYGDLWDSPKNAFLYASGFSGGTEFFRKRLLPYCVQKRSFKQAFFEKSLQLESDLILQEELKGLGGKDAPRRVFERLVSNFQLADEADLGFDV